MTRDEVLKYLTNLADEYTSALEAIEGSGSKLVDIYVDRAKALRAAAEIIRESGWQSLHHGLDSDTGLTCGMWEKLPNGKHRWYVSPQQMTPAFAIRRGFTHYLPEPAPPAREVENG